MPTILVPCPNCKSHALSPSTLSSLNPLYVLPLLLLLPPSLNPTTSRKYLYVMAMDICLYALMFNLTPIYAMLSVYMIFRILSNVHCFWL